MFDPRRGFGWLAPFGQMWALILLIGQRPTEPISPRRRWILRIGAIVVSVLSLTPGLLFTGMTFEGSNQRLWFTAACLTFGLFGVPTTILAIVILGLLAKVGVLHYGVATVVLMLAYLLQWQGLAWALFQRSRGPRR